MTYPPAPQPGSVAAGPRKRWPLYTGIGCGCLLLILVVIAVVALVALAPWESDDETPTETTTISAGPETDPETEPVTEVVTDPETTTTTASLEVTAADEQAAKERFIAFVVALGDADHDAACVLMLNPLTREPYEDSMIQTCVQIVASGVDAESTEDYRTLGALMTTDAIESRVNADDSITLTIYDVEFPASMVRAGDGLWYVDFGM